MANLLVFIDVREGAPTAPSCFALGEARRVANELGGTVYAVLATGPIAQDALASLTHTLGAAGSDKILFCSDPALEHAPLDATHGRLLATLADRLQPVLSLFPAGATGPELGPPLAVRSGATYCPRASIELLPAQTEGDTIGVSHLTLKRWRAKRDRVRVYDLGVSHRARSMVATLAAGELGANTPGGDDAELQVVSYPAGPECPVEEVSSEPDDAARAELASVIVIVPDELPDSEARQELPPGTAVVTWKAPPPSLPVACPTLVVAFGAEGRAADMSELPELGLAPDTHVAMVLKAAAKTPRQSPGFVNVTWPSAGEQALPELLQALRKSRSAGDRRDHEP